MKAIELHNEPVPDECQDWLQQTIFELDREVHSQALLQGSHIMRRDGAAHQQTRNTTAACALFDTVLSGEYAHALDICHKALANPEVGARRIYTDVMLPTIRMVGKAWAEDSASFERTSLAFSLLHRLLDRLAQATSHTRASLVSARLQAVQQRIMVAVAPGDSHSFGAKILTQELRLRGWRVTFFDHRQTDAVVSALAEHGVDTLAISVSCDERLAGLADFVTTCRMANRDPHLDVLIGGAAIQPPFTQYGFLQADRVGLGIEEVGTYLLSRESERQVGKWT